MDEHVHKFLELLIYVDYIKDERVKIQILLESFPQNFRERIEFVNPPSLDSESIRIPPIVVNKDKENQKLN